MSIDPAFGPRARNAAVFAYKAFLHNNSNGVVALLGHVIAPPPGMEGADPHSIEAAPSSVKLLLDTLAVATARTLDQGARSFFFLFPFFCSRSFFFYFHSLLAPSIKCFPSRRRAKAEEETARRRLTIWSRSRGDPRVSSRRSCSAAVRRRASSACGSR